MIVNTCAVTAEAVRQARQAIRRARRDIPSGQIIVTGCAAQTEARSVRRHGGSRSRHRQCRQAEAPRAIAPMAFGVPLNDKVQVNDIMSVQGDRAAI